jgi:Protein of unknown function (DUF2442)
MATSARTLPIPPEAVDVRFEDERLVVDLSDGRTIAVPLAWYPRLFDSTAEELASWTLIGGGEGIHWPDIDEDLSVAGLLEGAKGAIGVWPGEPRASERNL